MQALSVWIVYLISNFQKAFLQKIAEDLNKHYIFTVFLRTPINGICLKLLKYLKNK